jgi:hypothetical protein
MTTVTTNAEEVREKLHRYIDEMDDAGVIDLYENFKTQIEEEELIELPDEVKAELDQIEKDYENGKLEMFDWADVKKETIEYIKSKK